MPYVVSTPAGCTTDYTLNSRGQCSDSHTDIYLFAVHRGTCPDIHEIALANQLHPRSYMDFYKIMQVTIAHVWWATVEILHLGATLFCTEK